MMYYVNGRPLFLIFVREIRNFKMTIEQKKKKSLYFTGKFSLVEGPFIWSVSFSKCRCVC